MAYGRHRIGSRRIRSDPSLRLDTAPGWSPPRTARRLGTATDRPARRVVGNGSPAALVWDQPSHSTRRTGSRCGTADDVDLSRGDCLALVRCHRALAL